jgi:FkbM family methyltransferase
VNRIRVLRFWFGQVFRVAAATSWGSALSLFYNAYFRRRRLVALRGGRFTAPIFVRSDGTDMAAFEQVFFQKQYDLAPDGEVKWVIDAGANIGCASRFFRLKFPNATVVAVEPDEANFSMLERNTASDPKIFRRRAALWPVSEPVAIADPKAASWAFQVRPATEGEAQFPSVTVPELIAEHGIDVIDVFKIDIEGAEERLFSAPVDAWLPKVRMLHIELHDRTNPGCSAALFRAVLRRPFRTSLLGESLIIEFTDLPPRKPA